MNMKWALMPKEMRFKIRLAMVDEMYKVLVERNPAAPESDLRKQAINLTNLAIAREREKQKTATPAVN